MSVKGTMSMIVEGPQRSLRAFEAAAASTERDDLHFCLATMVNAEQEKNPATWSYMWREGAARLKLASTDELGKLRTSLMDKLAPGFPDLLFSVAYSADPSVCQRLAAVWDGGSRVHTSVEGEHFTLSLPGTKLLRLYKQSPDLDHVADLGLLNDGASLTSLHPNADTEWAMDCGYLSFAAVRFVHGVAAEAFFQNMIDGSFVRLNGLTPTGGYTTGETMDSSDIPAELAQAANATAALWDNYDPEVVEMYRRELAT